MFQCVPNLSEGRRPEVVQALVDAVRRPGLSLADFSCDPDHNRMVISLLGSGPALEEAILAMYAEAARHLSLDVHEGAHPRVGVVDVVPFVPLLGTPMEEAVELARRVARQVAERYELPVFLYEKAALRPDRTSLPDIRKGQLEGLRQRLLDPAWEPDFGPRELHPRLGATVIGARLPLVAYNVLLDTDDLSAGQAIARKVRERDGGLRTVRAIAIALKERRQVQISLNLTDPGRTGLYTALEMVRMEARRYGAAVVSSEVVGLCPLEALLEAGRYYLQLENFKTTQVLEQQIWEMAREKV